MGYRVGIDFGTTFTAAAVHRDGEQAVELVPLGDNKAAVASVVYVAPDGGLVMGDAAVRRAVTDPDRVIREVKRRIGDETPVLVAGQSIDAHTIGACFVRWVVDRVSEREGAWPTAIALTHPASWGRHKCDLLTEALAAQGIGSVRLVPEPAAAAFAYAASRDVEPGSSVGVYDLGGGTFDAAIVCRGDDGAFTLAGSPVGIESLGGIDFDEAVLAHVQAAIGPQWTELDFDDPLVRTAAAALRRECTEAKEALSADTEVTIPVMLPGVSMRVRMVRTELEQLVAPAVGQTVEAMRRACASAGLAPEDLSVVLLAGGSSRIPLVAQQLSDALDRPVTVDADPKAVVASGAALSIAPEGRVVASTPLEPTVIVPKPVGRWSRRGVVVGTGIAVCLAALVAMASTVGMDLLPGDPPEGKAAELPREVVDRVPIGTPSEAKDDPWTGDPYRDTTAPGPTRPGAKPAEAAPAALSPTPTTGGDRDAQIDGAPPSTQTVSTTADSASSSAPPTDRSVSVESTPSTTTEASVTTTTTPEPSSTTTTTTVELPSPSESVVSTEAATTP